MSRTILVMAAGTGGHVFGSGTLAGHARTLDAASGAASACAEDVASLRGERA